MVNFILNGQAISGIQAEAAYIEWCLSLENGNNQVPRTSLDAMADFQEGAFRANAQAKSRIEQSGIAIQAGL